MTRSDPKRGVVGHAGHRDATKVILNGRRHLEYRGYDSAGICTLDKGGGGIRRSVGKLVNLENLLKDEPLHGTTGTGHTRWAIMSTAVLCGLGCRVTEG